MVYIRGLQPVSHKVIDKGILSNSWIKQTMWFIRILKHSVSLIIHHCLWQQGRARVLCGLPLLPTPPLICLKPQHYSIQIIKSIILVLFQEQLTVAEVKKIKVGYLVGVGENISWFFWGQIMIHNLIMINSHVGF